MKLFQIGNADDSNAFLRWPHEFGWPIYPSKSKGYKSSYLPLRPILNLLIFKSFYWLVQKINEIDMVHIMDQPSLEYAWYTYFYAYEIIRAGVIDILFSANIITDLP